MTSQRLPTRGFQLSIAAACLTVAVAVAFSHALVLVRTRFTYTDDEGFMLMTLRQYVSGLPLYDKAYTEYGPFYYVLLGNVFTLAGISHDAIRLTTVVFWLVVAAGWATCVWLWSRSLGWTLAAFLTTANILGLLRYEPGHPQSLVLVLYAATFVAANFYSTAPLLAFTVIGAVSAAMLLTKINVGVFLVAALVAVFVACLPPPRRPRMLDVGVRVLCTSMPAVLMHSQFGNPIALMQCAIYTFGIWSVLDALHRNASPDLNWQCIGWVAVGFCGTALLTCGIVYWHGTSVNGLLHGIILQPLRFSGAIPFYEPHTWLELYERYLAALCGAGGALLWIYQRFRGGIPRYVRVAVALIVILAEVFIPRLTTVIAPSVMWMFVPEPGGYLWKSTSRVPAFLVSVAATLGVLMVYPVPGTQSSVAASIIVLAAFAALLHSREVILRTIERWRIGVAPEWVLAGLIIGMTLIASFWEVRRALDRPAPAAAYLPHSRMIQLSTADYETFSEIVSRVSARCDALVTLPGMNSFNIWSNLPHPNGSIVSAAMVLFDEPVQQRLVKDFRAASRPCVIWNAELEQYGAQFRLARANEPFVALVHTELVPVYERDGYEIRVPSNQASQWH